ncbi:class I SAM-dependent methyltransferase [Gaoshiqia sp. Z1-71]|uniref:class I SAM-dependent methyltransferase n=1 Tax=Gaoshiqia hydrogeniformans TaxID=3290090 RepID=UPI003BF7B43C
MALTDPIAQGVYDYHFKRIDSPVIIHCDEFEPDEVLPSYFFRNIDKMPGLERQALQLAKGKILDVGACAGCHSFYLQNKGNEVYALEQAELSCRVLADRGIRQVIREDFFHYQGEQFDTILLLMNGTGIAGTLDRLNYFFNQLKLLLAPGGQILIDSSDLIYLYLEEDGTARLDLNADRYYGELTYQTEYNGQKGAAFPWLYTDPETLSETARQNNLQVEKIIHGEHFDYLSVIKHI